jgi:1,4-alpha-glucan branching enzyme
MAFVRDVVRVWFDELGIDGMRFDHTLGFYHWKDQTVGAGAVAEATREIGGDGCYRIAEHFSNDQNELELLKDSRLQLHVGQGLLLRRGRRPARPRARPPRGTG